MDTNFKHLNQETQNIIHNSKDDRIQALEEFIWIEYPRTQEVMKLLKRLLDTPKKRRNEKNERLNYRFLLY